MEIIPTATSLVALSISIFTFWWSNIRQPKAFHLVCLSKAAPFETIDFALVNGGKHDLLVTSVALFFEGHEVGSTFYPAIRIHGGSEGSADLLGAGKAIEFRAAFTEPLASSFATLGRQNAPWKDLFSHVIGVELSWVDIRGNSYTAKVSHSRLGLTEAGLVRARGPVDGRYGSYNLYKQMRPRRSLRW